MINTQDSNMETAAKRIGNRIREIRESMGMSRAELGEAIGLNANRIQQYENGRRKPKSEGLKKIASVLGVSTHAITDPVFTNYIGAMHGLFVLATP